MKRQHQRVMQLWHGQQRHEGLALCAACWCVDMAGMQPLLGQLPRLVTTKQGCPVMSHSQAMEPVTRSQSSWQ